jgi:hypothetical protein
MAIQTSMGANKLDVRYGDRNTLPYYNGIPAVTTAGGAGLTDAAVTSAGAANVYTAGKVYSVTSAGFLVPGIIATSTVNGSPIPFYSLSGLDINNYPDVQRDRGMPAILDKATDAFYGIPTSTVGVGVFATIRHNAAVELSTTAFKTSDSYAAGDALTAVSAIAATAADRGKLKKVAAGTDVIVGYVAPAGKYTGPEGYSTLAFTPAFVAGTTVSATL